MQTETERTRSELSELKQSWRSDPCWDIEDTDGFLAHHSELLAFRQQCEAEWTAAREAKEDAKAAEVGCAGNRALGAYLLSLEAKIESLGVEIYHVQYPLG